MRGRLPLVWLAAALTATGVGLAGGGDPPAWPDPVDQWTVIRFSHRLHVQEVEAECGDCHDAASSESSSDFLFPDHDQCSACHDVEDDEDACADCHVGGEIEGYERPERTILFDHRLHLEQGDGDCAACHAGVELSEVPSVAHLPGMDTCAGCHLDVDAPRSCEACHVTMENLVPLSHRRVGWDREHQALMRAGGWSNECAACHSENDCQACHVQPTLQLTRDAPVRVVPEFRPAPEGRESLMLQRVHELDYVFRHPADARSKANDCYVCHDAQAFCAECHQREQDAGFGPPVPFEHRQPDFVRIGVGSGGGRHGELARRDIESCASCHDVQGRDPTCILCHVDRSPGLGNDPRTHSSRFDDRNGDWHSNAGSVCYNCHTDSGRSGIGFCGYCHGAEVE